MQCRCNAASCKLAYTVHAAHTKNSNILKKSGLHEAPTKEHYGVFNNVLFLLLPPNTVYIHTHEMN